MQTKLPYASLPALTRASELRQCISFQRKGTSYTLEPHKLDYAKRTRALVVHGWIQGIGWRMVPFAEIRGMEVLPESFEPRELPARLVRLKQARGPGK